MSLYNYATFSNQTMVEDLNNGYMGEVGAGFAPSPWGSSPIVFTNSNKVYATLGVTGIYYPLNVNYGTPDYCVISDFYIASVVAGKNGVLGRNQLGTSGTYYLFGHDSTQGRFVIESNISGAGFTVLASGGTVTLVAGNNYKLISMMSGSMLGLDVWQTNGTGPKRLAHISGINTSISSIGVPSTYLGSISQNTIGYHLDNYAVIENMASFLVVDPGLIISTSGNQTINIFGAGFTGTSFNSGTTGFTVTGAGSPSLSSINIASGNFATALLTPGSAGIYQLQETGGNNSGVGYFYVGTPRLSHLPNNVPIGISGIPVSIINRTYSNWTVTAPTFTFSGPSGGIPATFTGGSVVNNVMYQGILNTIGSNPGVGVFTETRSGATVNTSLNANISSLPNVSSNFTSTSGSYTLPALSNGGGWVMHAFGQGVLGTNYLPAQQLNTVYSRSNGSATALGTTILLAVDGGPMGFNQKVSCTVVPLSLTNTRLGLMGYSQLNSLDCIIGQYYYNNGNPTIRIGYFLNSSFQQLQLATGQPVLSIGVPYTFTLNLNETAQSFVVSSGSTVVSSIINNATIGNLTYYRPGYAGIYWQSFLGSLDSPYTGYQVGNFQANCSPRAVFLPYSRTTVDFPFEPHTCMTPNYAIHYNQDFLFGYNDNAAFSDYMQWRIPLNSPFIIPSSTLLISAGTNRPALIMQNAGYPLTIYNVASWWSPGVGTGVGRINIIWTLFPSGTNVNASYPGFSGIYYTKSYSSYSDDEGLSYSAPIDVTAFKRSDWNAHYVGASNCSLRTSDGHLVASLWTASPNQGGGTVTATSGSNILTFSSVQTLNKQGVFIPNDPNFNLYFCSGTNGTNTFTVSPPASITISGSAWYLGGQLNTKTWTISCTGLDGTGWVLNSQVVGSGATNECQIIQLKDGSYFACPKSTLGAGATRPQFVTSTDSGTTWNKFLPTTLFPVNWSPISIGLLNYYDAILYAGPNSSTVRQFLTATYSLDSGNTWAVPILPPGNTPSGTLICDGGVAYNHLAILPDGDILCTATIGAIGGSFPSMFKINPTWLTGAISGSVAGPSLGASGRAIAITYTAGTGTLYDVITPTDNGLGGSFTPPNFNVATSGLSKTFLYNIPATTGNISVSLVSQNSHGIPNFTFMSFASGAPNNPTYTFSGPSTLVANVSGIYSVTPSTTLNDIVTISDSGAGGVFYVSTLNFSNTSGTKTFLYKNATPQSELLWATSDSGYTITGSPISLTITPVIIVPSYIFTGPNSLVVNGSGTYTVQPNTNLTDQLTLSDGSQGGRFFPTSLSFANSSGAKTFNYSQGTAKSESLTLTSASGFTITGSPLSLTVVPYSYTVTGPTSLTVGSSGTYTITPNAPIFDTINLSDSGAGGTFYTTSVVFVNTSLPKNFNYSQSGVKNETLIFTSASGYSIVGSPIHLSVSSPAAQGSLYWKPIPENQVHNNGGTVFGASFASMQNHRIFRGSAGYPFLGVSNSYSDNKPVVGSTIHGVVKAISAGTFAVMKRRQFIVVGFTREVAGISSSILNGPGNFQAVGQALSNAYRNTWLKRITGGWSYQTGMPVNAQYSRDQFRTDAQGTGRSPGRITFQIGNPTLITRQNYSRRHGS